MKVKMKRAVMLCAVLCAAGAGAAFAGVFSPAKTPDTATALVPGMRAVSVPVPWHQAHFLKKGDRVDVVITLEPPQSGGDLITATLLQNVLVLDIIKPGKQEESALVRFLLNPVEAQYLALSVPQSRELYLTARPEGDSTVQPMEMSTFRKLFVPHAKESTSAGK